MGNGVGKLSVCFSGEVGRRRPDSSIYLWEPHDEGLGHSFCYIRPDDSLLSFSEESTTFRAISGASISANTSTPLSTSMPDFYSSNATDPAAAFESSMSFSSIPLQPIPRNLMPANFDWVERGFFSGPIERGFLSGPIGKAGWDQFGRSRSRKGSVISVLKRAFSKKTYRGHKSIVAPIKAMKQPNWIVSGLEDDVLLYSQNVQWAQSKAGEDRVHVVVSDEHGWVFVGIYDGFNGPDAPDFLLSNLYSNVHKELNPLLWDDHNFDFTGVAPASIHLKSRKPNSETEDCEIKHMDLKGDDEDQENSLCSSEESNNELNLRRMRGRNCRMRQRGGVKNVAEAQRMELDKRAKEQLSRSGTMTNHKGVLNALSQALRKTEESYLDIADKMVAENPELALMGSCVLVMVMKGEDVYVMNVGDSRAVLGQKADQNDLERITEESLNAVQLSKDHSTNVDEEVERIKVEHPDDADALMNDRVKGSLKVTRAFGAGFLKQPKWNNALLEMFRIDYQGTAPYITCNPSIHHHRLCQKDRFLILSSDGLYQYFTNEQAVSEVQQFLELQPEGDPAQHLVEQLIYHAANKAGMDFHELLDIPQGDRRRYHDDVSIIVVSVEGRIWRSCV